MRKVNVIGSYATAAEKSGFKIGISVELNEDQEQACLEAGLQSLLYRGGNSVLDKLFAPTKKNAKGVEVPDMTKFKRESVEFSPENVAKVQKALTSFFADGGEKALATTAVITVEEKVPGATDGGGLVQALAKVEAWAKTKTAEEIEATIEVLEEKNPGVTVKWVDGKPDMESFALLFKAETKRVADQILG